MLKVDLAPKAAWSRIQLDGCDISKYVKSITIEAVAGDDSHVVIAYVGPVVIEGEPGTVTLIPGCEVAV